MLLNCGAGEDSWESLARRSNQSILKEISPECSLGGLLLKLKLPIPWPPDAKSWLIGKDPDAGKVWGQKGVTEDGIIGCPQWTWVGENCRRRWRARKLGVLQSIGSQSQTQLSNWTRQVTYLLTVEIFIFPNHNLKILEGDTATDVKILTGLLAKLKPSIPF